MKTKLSAPSPRMLELRAELIALVQRKVGDMSSEDVLALLSYIVGQTIAFQDRRKHTPDDLIDFVLANIQQGNADAIKSAVAMPVAGRA
ncbi:MAG: hypothetical protein KF723_23075 [Rhizobiaceae bacterium]|nr:hypothetical protein [Rhizobiaceae bacterium]